MAAQPALPQFDTSCPDGHEWYLAIGSMINPTSLSLRELFPKRCASKVLSFFAATRPGANKAILLI